MRAYAAHVGCRTHRRHVTILGTIRATRPERQAREVGTENIRYSYSEARPGASTDSADLVARSGTIVWSGVVLRSPAAGLRPYVARFSGRTPRHAHRRRPCQRGHVRIYHERRCVARSGSDSQPPLPYPVQPTLTETSKDQTLVGFRPLFQAVLWPSGSQKPVGCVDPFCLSSRLPRGAPTPSIHSTITIFFEFFL